MRLGLSWRSSAPAIASIVPGAISWPWRDQVGQLADHGAAHLDRLVLAVEGEHVAAQVDLAVEVLLERPHDLVARARELGGHLVRKLELDAH